MTQDHLPPRLRVVTRVALGSIGALRLLAPAGQRERWHEEWRAEIQHAAGRLAGHPWATLRLVSFAAGAGPDALSLHAAARSSPIVASRDRWFLALGQDFRHAVRGLVAAPVFTATILASLSVGIAATTAAYAFINAALLPKLPGVTDQHRLVEVFVDPSTFDDAVSLRTAIPGFSAVASTMPMQFAVNARGQAISVGGAIVSANYFDVLGVRMATGRAFQADEGRRADAAVAIVGHALSRRVFGDERSALGGVITVGTQAVEIVGVAEEGFGAARPAGAASEIWLPSGLADRLAGGEDRDAGASRLRFRELTHIGRASASVSIDAVVAQARSVAARLASDDARGRRAFTFVRQFGVRSASGIALQIAAIMLVPLLVLLIGCINAANLLLARGAQGTHDTAIRLAVGASRWRIVRHWLAESTVIALAAGAVTLPLLAWTFSALENIVPLTLQLDLRVTVFACGISVASVMAFGLAPALRTASAAPDSIVGATRSRDTRRRSRMQQGLVAVQVALSLGLLATGGQLITAVTAIGRATGATEPSTLLMVSFDLAPVEIAGPAASAFYDGVLERVRRLPGVERAGIGLSTAMWTWGWTRRGVPGGVVWWPAEGPRQGSRMIGGYVDGELFEAVGLRLLQGRAFRPEDRTGAPRVAIVNLTTADRHFRGHALGQRVSVAARGQQYDRALEVEIVGVIEPALEPQYARDPDDPTVPALYLPARLGDEQALTLYVRTNGGDAAVLPAIQQVVRDVDSRVPMTAVSTLAQRQYERQTEERLAAQGLTTVGVLALVLACGGLYGMVAFIVSTRRREIGVRLALGANPASILGMMLRLGMRTATLGTIAGGAIAIASSVMLRARMYGVPPFDLSAFVATTALLLTAVAIASLMPAQAAARVDPLEVLRED